MEDFSLFMFLAAGAVSLFAFLTVAHWVDTQSAERQSRERFGLLRKIAEQPTESSSLVLELLREEDARARVLEQKTEVKKRRDGLQVGAILIAFGLAVVTAWVIASPNRRHWVVGLIPIFIGIVVVGFAAFNRQNESSRTPPSDSRIGGAG